MRRTPPPTLSRRELERLEKTLAAASAPEPEEQLCEIVASNPDTHELLVLVQAFENLGATPHPKNGKLTLPLEGGTEPREGTKAHAVMAALRKGMNNIEAAQTVGVHDAYVRAVQHRYVHGSAYPYGPTRRPRFQSLPDPEGPEELKLKVEPINPRPMLDEAKLIADLPALFEAHPTGIPALALVEKYGVAIEDVYQAIRWLESKGHGQWVFVDGRPGNTKVLIPPGAPYKEHDLSVKQEQVYIAMLANADHEDFVRMSFGDLERTSGVSHNGMGQHLWSLEQKGYIRLIRKARANGSKPSIYEVNRKSAETGDARGGHG